MCYNICKEKEIELNPVEEIGFLQLKDKEEIFSFL
jgi:hypothetical protein